MPAFYPSSQSRWHLRLIEVPDLLYCGDFEGFGRSVPNVFLGRIREGEGFRDKTMDKALLLSCLSPSILCSFSASEKLSSVPSFTDSAVGSRGLSPDQPTLG